MTISELARLVHKAVRGKPPKAILELCGEGYRPYYHLLYLLALHTDKACVELGVEKGRGCFAMALAGREVWGLDHTPRPELEAVRARFPDFHFLERPSMPVPGDLEGKEIGVLHVDTEHSYANAREEYRCYERLLCAGSVVCFDDVHAMEDDVGRFVSSLPWPAVFDDRLHECGYAAVVYRGE